jgi:Glycosyl transferase family 2
MVVRGTTEPASALSHAVDTVQARHQEPHSELSIVVPVHDGQDKIAPLHEALRSALEELGCSYEVIVVDDGSRDDTYRALGLLAATDRHLKLGRLRRNYGQTPRWLPASTTQTET